MCFADSIDFLSLDNLPKMLKGHCSGYCDACFSGKYPAHIPDYNLAKKDSNYCMPIKRY
jgi:amidophosphoribosyltransferase